MKRGLLPKNLLQRGQVDPYSEGRKNFELSLLKVYLFPLTSQQIHLTTWHLKSAEWRTQKTDYKLVYEQFDWEHVALDKMLFFNPKVLIFF